MSQGKITASFGPNPEFTRHSEGDFIRLKDGRILFVYSRFTGGARDDSPSDLAASYSSDEGESWTEPVTFIKAQDLGVRNIMSVSLMHMANGDLGVFFLKKEPLLFTRPVLMRSSDEGKTFSAPAYCDTPQSTAYLVVNNMRVIRLEHGPHAGRILIPAAKHGGVGIGDDISHLDFRSSVIFLYSDDDGRTWKLSPCELFAPFTHTKTGLQEPGVVELSDGSLYGYARTDQFCQYEFRSFDGGLHFTLPEASRFSSPPSPMKIVRCPADQSFLALWNPVPLYNGRALTKAGWGRTPFVMAKSTDEGLSWSDPEIIEDDPDCGYCYPAAFFTEDASLLLAYCAGGASDGSCLARLNIQKLHL
ncbi:MAG: exo-alpha-sialidase [Lachnospiraceae bacterium]|nr:exo-alpha-sialidase [Lachnospiraceae bacterium]